MDPALLFLARRKLRGVFRRQLRRLRTPRGLAFGIFGALLLVVWLGSLVSTRFLLAKRMPEVMEVDDRVLQWSQLGISVLGLFSLLTATSLIGVYFPKQEVERLFCAPVHRSDLVRLRLVTDLARGSFGALLLGLLTFQRMPVPGFGLVGVVVALLTLGILRQLLSLLLAAGRDGLLRGLRGRAMTVLRVAGGVLLGVGMWLAVMNSLFAGRFAKWFDLGEVLERGPGLFDEVWVQALLAPSYPYARLMTASTWSDFGTWLLASLLLSGALFELTARLPIDFREHSLETTERIAARLSQVRRGGLLSSGTVNARARRRRPPLLLGGGPVGAIAWIKLVGIFRKAGGTLLVGSLIVTVVTIGMSFMLDHDPLGGSAVIAGLCVTYLGGAMRFDFRAELDRMVWIKAWPVAPARVFVAMLAPQVLLTTLLVGVALWLRLAVLRSDDPFAWAVPLLLPPLCFAWLAVDNLVFLVAPFRAIPGQEGSLHHTGRAALLVFLRLGLTLLVGLLVGAVGVGLFFLCERLLGLGQDAAMWSGVGAGVLVLVLVDLGLARLGGRLLKRFDVARDAA